jgi:hypothetical protein
MSSRLELGPADLDRLEDALEDLELRPALELEADDPVAQRLVEYRALLQLGRRALPLEEVPTGLLDGVLAQARQAVAAAATVAPKPSFWARWRLGTWVPTLAFAGSAALLLLVLVPKGEAPAPTAVAQSEPSAPPMAAAEPRASDERLAIAQLGRRDEAKQDEDALRGAGVAIGERAPEAEPAPPVEEPEPEPAVDLEAQAVTNGAGRRKAVAPGQGNAGGATGSPPKPTSKAPPTSSGGKGKNDAKPDPLGADPTPQKKDDKAAGEDLWPEISRADADRRSGSCGLAKMRYDKLRKADDPRVRARALAGLGLCEAAAGDLATAKKLFDQARAADPDVSVFIDGELATLERARADDPSPQAAD